MENTAKSVLPRPRTDAFDKVMQLWQQQPFYPETEVTDFYQLLNVSPEWATILELGPCMNWIVDVRRQEYTFVSANVQRILGYQPAQLLCGGLSFLRGLMHPADVVPAWESALRIWQCLMEQSPLERLSYRFNRDYRLRQASGTYVRLLEQNAVLRTDCYGNITHLISIVSDVTDWKNGDEMVVCVLSANQFTRPVRHQSDKLLRPSVQLSKREREIVQLVAEGYSSKGIADRLSIAFNTVNTHRKKILDKTRAKTAGGMVQYAIHHGFI